MKTIGLTGTNGSGKGAAAKYFISKGGVESAHGK